MPNLAGSIQARYNKAEREFNKLEAVDRDPFRMNTVSDLVFIAQFELDLYESGDSELTPKEIKPIYKFVSKWS